MTAIKRALHFTRQIPPSSHAFIFLSCSDLTPTHLRYPMFVCKLRSILQELGLPAKDYASHSLSRGRAFFAFQAGVPVELIKMLGD